MSGFLKRLSDVVFSFSDQGSDGSKVHADFSIEKYRQALDYCLNKDENFLLPLNKDCEKIVAYMMLFHAQRQFNIAVSDIQSEIINDRLFLEAMHRYMFERHPSATMDVFIKNPIEAPSLFLRMAFAHQSRIHVYSHDIDVRGQQNHEFDSIISVDGKRYSFAFSLDADDQNQDGNQQERSGFGQINDPDKTVVFDQYFQSMRAQGQRLDIVDPNSLNLKSDLDI